MKRPFFSLQEAAQRLREPLTALRYELHEHPELSGREFETVRRLRAFFDQPPFEVLPLPVDNALAVRIPGKGPGKRVAIRADMDALPVNEWAENPVRSQTAGVMHASGHDMHMSFVCGAGLLLSQAQFPGEALLLFQPAEEIGEGAQALLDAGLFERYPVDHILGGHVKPELTAGKISVRTGPVMAALDGFCIEVEGKGGHGACPHACRDPIVAASAIVLALQTVVSRTSDPDKACVLSVCRIQGGEADNVIPDRVVLEGTMRTVDGDQRTACLDRLHAVVENTAAAMGCKAHIRLQRGMPLVMNDPKTARICRARMEALLGAEQVTALPVDTIAEDFALYAQRVPGCYMGIGTGTPKAEFHPLHSDRFFPADDLLPLGATVFAEAALALLNGDEEETA